MHKVGIEGNCQSYPLFTCRALPEIDAQVQVSSLESEHRFLGSGADVRSDIKLNTVSHAVSAFVVLMTGTGQNSSLSPPLEDESISK